MKIIINKYGDDVVELEVNPGPGETGPTFDEVIQIMMTAMDGVVRRYIKGSDKNKDWQFREGVYDQLDYLFDALLTNVFPEIKPNEFDLTAAAIVYAQDKLIEEAANEGISYKKALTRYEKKAKEYIINRDKLN